MNFRIGRTEISVSFPLVGIMTAIIIADRSFSVVICFCAALMHESGHIIALRLCGYVPEKISLTLFDIAITDSGKALRSFRSEVFVTLAGVAVNFLSSAAGFLVYSIERNEYLMMFISVHLVLGLFNSLPVSGLDGGQVLALVLSRRMTPRTADRIMKIISAAVLVPAAAAGFLVLIRTRYNFTLLTASLYLLAAALLGKS